MGLLGTSSVAMEATGATPVIAKGGGTCYQFEDGDESHLCNLKKPTLS